MSQSPPKECEACDDKPGEIGQHPPDNMPLGDLEKCDECGRWACPVCLCERYCCDMEADDDR